MVKAVFKTVRACAWLGVALCLAAAIVCSPAHGQVVGERVIVLKQARKAAESTGEAAAIRLVSSMPRRVAAVVIVPSGQSLIDAVSPDEARLALLNSAAFGETARRWKDVAAKLGWSQAESVSNLLGGTSAIIWCPDAEPDGQNVANRPGPPSMLWAVIADVSAATEQRLRERLEAAPKTIVGGRPVLSVDAGHFLMFVRKKQPVAGTTGDRPFWIMLTPTSSQAIGQADRGDDGAGERLLNVLAPAIWGEKGTDEALTLKGHAVIDSLKNDGLGLATLVTSIDDWAGSLTATLRKEDQRTMQLSLRARSKAVLQAVKDVRATPDGLFDALHTGQGFTIVDAAPAIGDADGPHLGAMMPTTPWRGVFGPQAEQIGIISVQPDTGAPKREDEEQNWRFLFAQQLRGDADGRTAARDGDAVMNKVVSIVESGRVPGPAKGRGQVLASFDGVDPFTQRSVRANSQPASFYLRLFGPQAWTAWGVTPGGAPDAKPDATPETSGWWFGTICTAGREPGVSPAQSDGAAQQRADDAMKILRATIDAARSAEGPRHRWISRGFVELSPVRTAAAIMFSPLNPVGPALVMIKDLRWDVWADESNDLRATLRVRGR